MKFFGRKFLSAIKQYQSIIITALALIVLYLIEPAEKHIYLPCWFYVVTGLKCPLCGGLRGTHQLLHGHLGAALWYNPLLVIVLPWLVLLFFEKPLAERFSSINIKLISKRLNYFVLVLLFLFWVFRNLTIYPLY